MATKGFIDTAWAAYQKTLPSMPAAQATAVEKAFRAGCQTTVSRFKGRYTHFSNAISSDMKKFDAITAGTDDNSFPESAVGAPAPPTS